MQLITKKKQGKLRQRHKKIQYITKINYTNNIKKEISKSLPCKRDKNGNNIQMKQLRLRKKKLSNIKKRDRWNRNKMISRMKRLKNLILKILKCD